MNLQAIAHRIRRDTFKAGAEAGGGHFGGPLSLSEILAALYFKVLRVDPAQPEMEGGDFLKSVLQTRGVV